MFQLKRFGVCSYSLICLALAGIGCETQSYTRPIANFQTGSSAVIDLARIQISQVNKVERDAYIQKQLQAKKQIALNEIEASRIISADDLAARLEALNALAKYGEVLARLANSDAPSRIESESKELGTSAISLASTIQGLSGGSNDAFKEKAGVLVNIFTAVAKAGVEKRIDTAIRAAVRAGDEPVRDLLAQLQNDLQIAFERRRSLLSNERVTRVDKYNRLLTQHASDAQLEVAAEDISNNETDYDLFPTSNPASALKAMADAHTALVEYAKEKPTVNSLATLADAMELFASRAQFAAQAYKTLAK